MQTPPVPRRMVLTLLLPSLVYAREQPTRKWLIGRWRSDGKRTASGLSFQGNLLTPEQQRRAALEFGKMFYVITERAITVGGWVPDQSLTYEYRVASETSSSITLEFPRRAQATPLTLYRESDNWLFVRSAKNIEYLRREDPNAA